MFHVYLAFSHSMIAQFFDFKVENKYNIYMSNKQMRDEETQRIIQELEGVVGLPGDVVEFGCYRGETSVLLAEALSNTPDKWLWLYDSFEGLPQKQKEDVSATALYFAPVH